MKLPYSLCLLYSLIAISPATFSETEPYLSPDKVYLLGEGQRLLFNDQFKAVDSLYDAYIDRYPGDPAGYLFKAAALMGEMADREENLYPDLFISLLDSVETSVARQIDSSSDETRAWLYLYQGHAKAYRSLWESRFGSFISAVKLGFAARSEYGKGLEADSNRYDIYLGLGSYHYWKSAKGGLLRFFRILKNEKEKGIQELYLAADSSLLSREPARNALIWIWLDRKEYDSVVSIAQEFATRYPDGKSFLWPLAAACYEEEEFPRALEVYQNLRGRIMADPGNYYNLVECDYFICRALEKMNQKKEAQQHAATISKYHEKIDSEIRKRQRKKIAYLARLATH